MRRVGALRRRCVNSVWNYALPEATGQWSKGGCWKFPKIENTQFCFVGSIASVRPACNA